MDFTNLPPEKPELEEKSKIKTETKKTDKLFSLRRIIIISVISGFLSGGIGSLYIYSELKEYVKKTNSEFTSTLGLKDGKYTPQTSQEELIIKAVKDAAPAVVSIVISKNVIINQQPIFDPFSGFEDFFGPSPFATPQAQPPIYRKQEVGGGTGVIVSSDGMVLTNKHVVLEKDAEYTILTNSGRRFPAKVLARDPVQDIAILKIDQEKEKEKVDSFPVANLGDSDSIELGQTAVAIGNALGEYKNTISVGVISGLARSINASGGGFVETLEDIIQTDAAINEGNSGGPLLNLRGEVIGINTAMVVDAQSIGFAIPINKAKRDIEQMQKIGKIVYPFLGVRYVLIDEKVKEGKELAVDYGALVMNGAKGEPAVYPKSASDKAGIKAGDIILEINGEKITMINSLVSIISKFSPNDKVQLKVLRDKQEKTIEVVLDERPEDK